MHKCWEEIDEEVANHCAYDVHHQGERNEGTQDAHH